MELLTHKSQAGPEIVAIAIHPPLRHRSVGCEHGERATNRAELAGVSHFLEHMVFKGTKRRSAEQVNSELDHLGAQSNAFTSEESTVFHACVLPECQDQAVDLLTDIMRPSLRKRTFRPSAKSYWKRSPCTTTSRPMARWNARWNCSFGNHSLGRRVLGTAENSWRDDHRTDGSSITNSVYTLDNMVLVASGQVDFQRLVEQTESLVSNWRGRSKPRERTCPSLVSTAPSLSAKLHISIHGQDLARRRLQRSRAICLAVALERDSR